MLNQAAVRGIKIADRTAVGQHQRLQRMIILDLHILNRTWQARDRYSHLAFPLLRMTVRR